MKIFVSWSGKTSHSIALLVRDWLPTVIPSVELWVSSEDIDKGERWNIELAHQLEQCSCGIICVDSSNVNSPWLNFEAGALSKSLKTGKIFPLLYKLEPSDLRGPLTQFQVTTLELNDFLKLSQAINKVMEEPVPPEKIDKAVKYSWLELQNHVTSVPAVSGDKISVKAPEEKEKPSKSIELSDELSDDEKKILSVVCDSHRIAGINRPYLMLSEIRGATKLQYHKLDFLLSGLVKNKLLKTDGDERFYITESGISYLIQQGML